MNELEAAKKFTKKTNFCKIIDDISGSRNAVYRHVLICHCYSLNALRLQALAANNRLQRRTKKEKRRILSSAGRSSNRSL
jgi:hypothetical protein